MSVQIFQWQSQLALAKNALISGDYLTAEEYLTAAMTSSHDENAPEVAVADIFYHRGVCFENKDRFVDARRAFNQAQHTFSRCLGATSSQALKASKAKCLVDIKMGRTAEAQSEFQEIMQLLKSDPGDFTAEIVAMETEMRQMLAHPEPPAMPGTEVEIEPYAESWTPVRRTAEFVAPAVTHAPPPELKSERKVSMPAEVSDAIAHLSKSGQMAAVPESYLTGGVTERLTSIGNKRPNPVVESSPDSEFHVPSAADGAAESARVAAAEAARKAADEESRLAQIEIQRVAAEEESRFAAAENARIAAEEEAARQDAAEAERIAGEAEATLAAAEAARIATEEEEARAVAEAARIAHEEESTRAAQAEAARIVSEEESARAAVEAARIASEEEEAARLAAEATRIAAELDACRAAEAEATRIAGEEESARIAREEAARIASEEEAARATEAEAARIAAEEESTRTAQAEVARMAAEEEAAAAEAARKAQEESARTEADEAARKAADEISARLAAEAAAATEAARIASEDVHRDTVANIARKAEEIEQARNAAADAARKAAEEQEKNAAATEAAKKAADEAARIEAEELARKTDEEARRAAAESRRAAEEEVRLASAEAARKAREEKAHAAESANTSAANDFSKTAGLSSEFEFDSSTSLTGQSLSNDLHESWALMPLETPGAATTADPNEPSAQTTDVDVKVRIVRSQPEAYVQKRLDGTMIDMPARKPPGLAPQEPHLSFVKAQTPYPSELNRRIEPPVKPDDQPERRQSLLSQVADELAGQLAGQIEAQSSEKIATDVASSLAAQVHEVAQANEHLVAQAATTPVAADPFKTNVESSTWSEVVAKSQGNSSPVAAAAAASPLFAPQVEAPSPSVFSRPPDLTPIPDKPAANPPAVAWEPQPKVTDNRLEPVGEPQKRPYTKTMMDMSAAGVQEQAYLAANPPAKSTEVVKDVAPAKNVDVAKVNEFQQRLSESARVNPPLPAPPAAAKDSSSPADDGPITELSPYSGNAPSADDKFDRSKRPSTSSRNPKVVQPVSQPKSLITPRQFIRPISIPELTNAREPMYAKVSTIVSALLYLASVICIVGIIAIPLMMAIKFARDGIKLGRIRGKGIRVTPEQFPEVFEAVHNLAASLGMPTAPDTYIVHEQGHLTVSAQRLHGKDLVVVYADVLELAYSFGESELAFIISHELAHIQCGHLNRWFIDFPAKCIPFVGAALSRAREYTCDRIAQELVPEGAAMGLVALSAGTKLYRRINLKALYAQQDADDDFWTRFSETLSHYPNLNNRIKALGPAEDKSKPGKPVATAPSKRY